MVDARRMEVYTAVYDPFLQEQLAPAAMILEERSFQNLLDQQKIIFAGNGAVKWKNKCAHTNALFYTEGHPIVDFAAIADQKYKAGDFTDLVYSEPSYLKNVYFNN